jgi:hypothetical protein
MIKAFLGGRRGRPQHETLLKIKKNVCPPVGVCSGAEISFKVLEFILTINLLFPLFL